TARTLGAEPDLFRLIQLAVLVVQTEHTGLGLPVGARVADAAASFGLGPADLEALAGVTVDPGESDATSAPHDLALLGDLLALAAENRRLAEAPALERLESDVDQLHHAFEDQRHSEASRLQANKLTTLAEFAAGAGHEINNPLAVISGQAQYLLGHEM